MTTSQTRELAFGLPVRAVGPPLTFRDAGTMFEEVLVVTDARDRQESASWRDDDLPRVRCRAQGKTEEK
ncbi:hypothetical protein ACFYO5_26875 [Streptomyces sp. NPDC006259]|uniref:hypothetical protein n=1 Tax=Streptomyces sp. NPDC006259 TaxID=3364740 RepID=UPI0036B53C00